MNIIKYVALGSSFAAGPSIDPIIQKDAGRSGNNYAHLLAAKLNANLTDLSVSGATLLSVLRETQTTTLTMAKFPPQTDQIPADTNIVTLTAGGNDLGYSRDMIMESVDNAIHAKVITTISSAISAAKAMFSSSSQAAQTSNATPEEVTTRFIEVIDKIHMKAPKAKIYLVEYLEVFTDDSKTGDGTNLTADQIKKFRKTSADLAGAYCAAAKARPEVTLIRTAEASKAHGLGSAKPWVTPFDLVSMMKGQSTPYHPNKIGMQAVADLIYAAMVARDGPKSCL